MRTNRLLTLLVLGSLIALSIWLLNGSDNISELGSAGPSSLFYGYISPKPSKPLPPSTPHSHPIYQLITDAETKFENGRSNQSSTLEEAVAEYRRRYHMNPPPKFDKWYAFAKRKRVQLVDDYDTTYHSLLPFWALEPKTIRDRAKESIGFDNAMIALLIRGGEITKVEGGGEGAEWHREALKSMLKNFVKHLPDMDVVFNMHDEPRVVVQDNDLSRLVNIATDTVIPQSLANPSPKNAWSPRPSDLNDGRRIAEVKTTRFNRFAHQPTWTNSRISCPADSPARALDEKTHDNVTAYAFSDLGFVYNTTAFSDICFSPSLQRTFGFFDRPNAFDVVHDLFPVFSQSKVSSFQDILYPSPWYWVGRFAYDDNRDRVWDAKEGKMFWRGSTTGGFSRDSGWRRQHRQRLVQKINGLDNAKVLDRQDQGSDDGWTVKEVPRQDLKDLFDVHFTYIGQCDPGDCDAQKEFFEVVEPVDGQDAWAYKYLLDMDGNAFSGRYYAFLLSNSLVYKQALFREWHEEWLEPWVHYVPLSLTGEEYVESVRYFDAEEEGKAAAQRIARQGQEWARKVLRNEDMEVWFFRLLLE